MTFIFEQTGVGDDGRVVGRFRATAPSEPFLEKLRVPGLTVSPQLFEDVPLVE